MRLDLRRLEAPGEREAAERAWRVLRAAHAEREPSPRPLPWKPLAGLALAAALFAAVLSPPGDALLDGVREAFGVEDAEVALFALPAEGRVLATSPEGAWVVAPDGSKRLLGPYREAAWSPFGRFVVATRANELAALEPDGDVRWTLARPGVRLPAWGGTTTDTRVAYLSEGALRVVAGDGTGDRAVDPAVAPVAPAWRPGGRHVLAYVDRDGRTVVLDVPAGRVVARIAGEGPARALAWAPDGRLAVVGRDGVVVAEPGSGRAPEPVAGAGALEAAFAPDGRVAVLFPDRVEADGTTVFAAPGALTGLGWSPDGEWLLVAWPSADQWVFLRGERVEAAANVADAFGGFARPLGWCCAAPAPAAAAVEEVEAEAEPAAAAPARPTELPRIRWRRSTSLGLPHAGALVDGVELPAEGPTLFTWHPVERRSPNPRWRRHGADRVVRIVLRILEEHAAAFPGASRVGVGDLSRPQGGDFGPKHVSHQNGLDVDVYFPRRDGRERPPRRPRQIDRARAQDLVDRLVAAGAVKVFVGPRTDLTGPPDVVQVLANHDNHLHARFAPR